MTDLACLSGTGIMNRRLTPMNADFYDFDIREHPCPSVVKDLSIDRVIRITMKPRSISLMAVVFAWAIAMAAFADGPSDAVRQVVEGNTAFACDLYAQLKQEPGNLFFSPYSLSAALAMTYAGARSNTAAEIQKAMHFTLGETETHPAFAALNDLLAEAQKKQQVQLQIANSLWPQKDYPFLPEFMALTKKHYGVTITPLDYAGSSETARQTINRWVEDKTQSKIKELIQPGGIESLTRLVLVNAIYFKGKWERQFKPAQTVESDFFVTASNTVRIPLMTQTHAFRYAELDEAQLVELPYVGRDLSLLAILPKAKDGLAGIEARLTQKTLAQWQARLVEQEVRVELPKFNIAWGVFELNKALKTLGMREAFSATHADFSGMDGRQRWLYINRVLHKAVVDVNEEGTEAAAATAIAAKVLAMPPPPPCFRADHPFLFLILEKQTGSILFMGRLTEPTWKNF